ncbi:hypothetical protein D3C87_1328420 [compost metagenome]
MRLGQFGEVLGHFRESLDGVVLAPGLGQGPRTLEARLRIARVRGQHAVEVLHGVVVALVLDGFFRRDHAGVRRARAAAGGRRRRQRHRAALRKRRGGEQGAGHGQYARHGAEGAGTAAGGRGGAGRHGRGGQKQAHVRAVRYTPRHSSKAAGRAAQAAGPSGKIWGPHAVARIPGRVCQTASRGAGASSFTLRSLHAATEHLQHARA